MTGKAFINKHAVPAYFTLTFALSSAASSWRLAVAASRTRAGKPTAVPVRGSGDACRSATANNKCSCSRNERRSWVYKSWNPTLLTLLRGFLESVTRVSGFAGSRAGSSGGILLMPGVRERIGQRVARQLDCVLGPLCC